MLKMSYQGVSLSIHKITAPVTNKRKMAAMSSTRVPGIVKFMLASVSCTVPCWVLANLLLNCSIRCLLCCLVVPEVIEALKM